MTHTVQLFDLCSSTPSQLLPCPKEAAADPLPKCLHRILLRNVTKSLKEAVADPAWVQSTKQQYIACVAMCVVYSNNT